MRDAALHGVTWNALGAALVVTPVIGCHDIAGQHRMIVMNLLAGHRQTEAIEQAEAVEIRGRESSVEHVEVFRLGCVRTPIIGRPRHSSRHRRAATYTLICEEPDYWAADKQFMLNLRVTDLDSLLAQFHASGIAVIVKPEWNSPEVGRFARIHDPEGNAIELWERPAVPLD